MEYNAYILDGPDGAGNPGSFGVDGEKFVFRYYPKPGLGQFFKRMFFLAKAGEFQKYWTEGATVVPVGDDRITLSCTHKHNKFEYHFRLADGPSVRDQIVNQVVNTFRDLKIATG